MILSCSSTVAANPPLDLPYRVPDMGRGCSACKRYAARKIRVPDMERRSQRLLHAQPGNDGHMENGRAGKPGSYSWVKKPFSDSDQAGYLSNRRYSAIFYLL